MFGWLKLSLRGGIQMYEQRMNRYVAVITVLLAVSLFGCSDAQKQAPEQKAAVLQQESPPVDAATQEAFRKKLSELGIPIYKGATFMEIKKKSKAGSLLAAVYEAPASRAHAYSEVISFYAAKLKKALVPKGWISAPAADNVILYRKDFEIFYVEFSQVIIPPDTKKIRVVFHFGN